MGQNFLKSKEALRDIVQAGQIQATDTILEIGPGKGVLTEKLLESAGKVIAIEKDGELIELLREKFKSELENKKLELISGDALEYEPEGKYKLIANIPYYITGLIIQKFLTASYQPELMVLLVQKEVAERITGSRKERLATHMKESILSISVKAYGTPKYGGTVKAKYFSPEPNVDSAILIIKNISKNFFADISEEKFFEVVKLGFAHKRKMLLGNLKQKFKEKNLEEIFNRLNIPLKIRAENLNLENWKELTRAL